MLCVSFSSKSKVTNVFPKHILPKTYSKINSRKEEIVFSGDSKKLLVQRFKFLIKIESTKRWEIKEETP